MTLLLGLALWACAPDDAVPADDTVVDDTTAPPEDVARTLLPPEAQLVRQSMALRGVRPTVDELDAVRAAPDAAGPLVDAWLDDPRFGATVRDLYAEVLSLRATNLRMPQLGVMATVPEGEIMRALSEEPLALIERVVMEDQPFTEIVTADWSVLDGRAAKIWRGHDYAAGGPDVQIVHWTDGRPAAGLLSTNGLWARHVSNGANDHRGRANRIAGALLCEDFLTRDVPIDGSVDLSDPDEVAHAVSTNPACVSCHQALDPLAANLWTVQPVPSEGAVFLAQATGCVGLLDDLCYPIKMHYPELAPAWLLLGLRPPSYYGQQSADRADLGQHIASDPRFAQCAAKRAWAHLTETPLDEVPFEVTVDLQRRFVASNYDFKALARDVVTHPDFLSRAVAPPAPLPGPQIVRPEALGRMIEDLTGFRYIQQVDNLACTLTGLLCYGDVDLTADDTWGMRAMAGGVNGERVIRPTHTPTPTRLLFQRAIAEEAAGWVVPRDLREPDPAQRHLLRLVEGDTADEPAVRAQIAWLHARVLGEVVPTESPEVDASWALWSDVASRRAPDGAWQALIAALLQSPRAMFY